MHPYQVPLCHTPAPLHVVRGLSPKIWNHSAAWPVAVPTWCRQDMTSAPRARGQTARIVSEWSHTLHQQHLTITRKRVDNKIHKEQKMFVLFHQVVTDHFLRNPTFLGIRRQTHILNCTRAIGSGKPVFTCYLQVNAGIVPAASHDLHQGL